MIMRVFGVAAEKHYNKHKVATKVRNQRGLETKWANIRKEVTKLCGCHDVVEALN